MLLWLLFSLQTHRAFQAVSSRAHKREWMQMLEPGARGCPSSTAHTGTAEPRPRHLQGHEQKHGFEQPTAKPWGCFQPPRDPGAARGLCGTRTRGMLGEG